MQRALYLNSSTLKRVWLINRLQMFPLHLRCTVLSVLYSTTASLAAGLTPVLSLMLLRKTNSSTTPSLIVVILVVFALAIMWAQHLRSEKIDALLD